jgi:hypothetical protein
MDTHLDCIFTQIHLEYHMKISKKFNNIVNW